MQKRSVSSLCNFKMFREVKRNKTGAVNIRSFHDINRLLKYLLNMYLKFDIYGVL